MQLAQTIEQECELRVSRASQMRVDRAADEGIVPLDDALRETKTQTMKATKKNTQQTKRTKEFFWEDVDAGSGPTQNNVFAPFAC